MWKVEWDERARRELRKLDPQVQTRILAFFRQRVMTTGDPRTLGKRLVGTDEELWRFRVGGYPGFLTLFGIRQSIQAHSEHCKQLEQSCLQCSDTVQSEKGAAPAPESQLRCLSVTGSAEATVSKSITTASMLYSLVTMGS